MWVAADLGRSVTSWRSGAAEIPAGFVRTYGDVSPGAPRFAGAVLFECDDPDLPWWRVVRADGRPARSLEVSGLRLLKADKTPLKGDRVDLERARFRIDGASS